MYCSACGHRGGPGDAFCYQCGHSLTPPAGSAFETAGVTKPGPSGVRWSLKEVVIGMAIVLGPVALLSLGATIAEFLGYLTPQPQEGSITALATWIASHAVGIVILLVVWFLALRRYSLPVSAIGFKAPNMKVSWAVGLSVLALALSLGFTALYGYAIEFLGLERLLPPDPGNIVFPGAAAIFSFEALAVWTPIVEEIFFRGFIFAGLSSRWGARAGLLASAAIFSLSHFSLGVIIPIFVTGILLAWLYHRTNSLWPPIAAHAGQNAIALLATMYGV